MAVVVVGSDTACAIGWNIAVIGYVCVCACVENGRGEKGLQRSKCALFVGLGLVISLSDGCNRKRLVCVFKFARKALEGESAEVWWSSLGIDWFASV